VLGQSIFDKRRDSDVSEDETKINQTPSNLVSVIKNSLIFFYFQAMLKSKEMRFP